MARERFCKLCGGWHKLDAWPSACFPKHNVARSSLPMPMLIGDNIEPTQSMADGKMYTSKAALRATYLPSGNPDGKRYTEVGDDRSVTEPKPFRKPRPKREEIKASVNKAFSMAGLGA